jgi:hydroxymethylglutaryl-CoA reductase
MSNRRIFSNKCSASVEATTSDKQTSTTKSQATSATSVDPWAGFYKKSLENRQQQIHGIFPHKSEELPDKVADHMIENCIGKFSPP